jgi:hypothetical protein
MSGEIHELRVSQESVNAGLAARLVVSRPSIGRLDPPDTAPPLQLARSAAAAQKRKMECGRIAASFTHALL